MHPTQFFGGLDETLLCKTVYKNAYISTSDAELLDGCFFWITSFVGQTLSKVGLIVEIASVLSAPSGLHSSISLTILGLGLIAYQVTAMLHTARLYMYLCVGLLGG